MNELRNILEQSVTRLFAARLDWDTMTRIEEEGWPQDLWASVVEQGIHKVLAAEQDGGMSGTWGDAFTVVRACGRYGVPLPIPEALLAEWLAAHAAVTLPTGIPGLIPRWLVAAEIAGDALSARIPHVPWGRHADYFIGLGEVDAHTRLIVAAAEHAHIDPGNNLALEPRDAAAFTAAPLLLQAPIELPGEAVHWLGAMLRSAQIAGAGAGCLELGVEYTTQREQFGRPLAKFQAIQHHLADLASTMASVDAMANAAFEALENRGIGSGQRDAAFEIAAAKCRANDAVEKLTRLSHQVHGAIGFTYEYGLHFLTRRLWAWRAEFGGSAEWSEFLGRLACTQGGDQIWSYMTS